MILACTLPGLTPPLVNTGLEVSSMDKNTLASQQRGRKARIPLSSVPIVHKELKTSTLITSDFFQWICDIVRDNAHKRWYSVTKHKLLRWMFALWMASIVNGTVYWVMWRTMFSADINALFCFCLLSLMGAHTSQLVTSSLCCAKVLHAGRGLQLPQVRLEINLTQKVWQDSLHPLVFWVHGFNCASSTASWEKRVYYRLKWTGKEKLDWLPCLR